MVTKYAETYKYWIDCCRQMWQWCVCECVCASTLGHSFNSFSFVDFLYSFEANRAVVGRREAMCRPTKNLHSADTDGVVQLMYTSKSMRKNCAKETRNETQFNRHLAAEHKIQNKIYYLILPFRVKKSQKKKEKKKQIETPSSLMASGL